MRPCLITVTEACLTPRFLEKKTLILIDIRNCYFKRVGVYVFLVTQDKEVLIKETFDEIMELIKNESEEDNYTGWVKYDSTCLKSWPWPNDKSVIVYTTKGLIEIARFSNRLWYFENEHPCFNRGDVLFWHYLPKQPTIFSDVLQSPDA